MLQKVSLCSSLMICLGLGLARSSEGTPIITIYSDRDAFNAAVEQRYGSGPILLTFDEPTICDPDGVAPGACKASYGGLLSFVIGPMFGDLQATQVRPNELMPPFVPYGGAYNTSSNLSEPAVAVGFDIYPADALGHTFPGGFEDPFFGTTVSVVILGQLQAVSSPQFFGVFVEPGGTDSSLTSLPVEMAPFCIQAPGPDPLCPPPNSFVLDNVEIKTVASVVPEPATAWLFACGIVGALAGRRRRPRSSGSQRHRDLGS